MNKLLTLIFFTLSVLSYGQSGEWTWMNGDSTTQSMGHYGTQGVFSPLNSPPSLYEACDWTDKEGNFWLYGGVFFGPSFGGPTMSDLWKFDPNINQWSWINGPGGSSNQIGIYGTQGIPSPTNTPGSRGWGTPTWVDTSGNLWLFGGYTYSGYRNDLWKYDIVANEWTWMKGDTLVYNGIYGTMGVSDIANFPSTRGETNATWTDLNNNLWLFGGIGDNGSHNDLWRYNIATNTWTWMKGSSTGNFDHGVYGTQGVADSTNRPSMRYCYSKWIDDGNNLWFYGGYEINTSFSGVKNDIWKYDITTNQWTWVSGDTLAWDTIAESNGKCNISSSNLPSSRYENRACWKISGDNFLTFGGLGNGSYNDLWSYNYSTNEWTWISGDTASSPQSQYGSITVSSPLNSPSGRFGSFGWKDSKCNLWFFGGVYFNSLTSQYVCLNDMWKYSLDKTCFPFEYCNRTTSISDIEFANSVLVFPNPFTDVLNSSCSNNEQVQIILYDFFSRKILQETFYISTTLNTKSLAKGIYIYEVRNKNVIIGKGKVVKD